jgi:hypothetical protein
VCLGDLAVDPIDAVRDPALIADADQRIGIHDVELREIQLLLAARAGAGQVLGHRPPPFVADAYHETREMGSQCR